MERITPEITYNMARKSDAEKSKYLLQYVENMIFGYGQ